MLNFDPGGRTGSESFLYPFLLNTYFLLCCHGLKTIQSKLVETLKFQTHSSPCWQQYIGFSVMNGPVFPPPFQQKPAKTKPFAKKSNSSFDLQQLETWIMSLQIWRENPSTKIDSSKNSIFCFKMIGDFVRSIVEQICLGAWICAQSWLTFLIIFDLPGAPQQGID